MSTETKTKYVTMKFPPSIYEAIKALAEKENRTISGQTLHLVKKALES